MGEKKQTTKPQQSPAKADRCPDTASESSIIKTLTHWERGNKSNPNEKVPLRNILMHNGLSNDRRKINQTLR